MNLTSTPDIIRDSAGLAQLCEQFAGADTIGLDTEFLRERTYFAQLCLLQLSSAGRRSLRRHAGAARPGSAAPGAESRPARKGAACRAPGSRGAVAGNRTGHRAVRYAGGGRADRHAGADRLWRPGAAAAVERRCTRPRRAPTGRAGRCRPHRSNTRWTTCATCCRCASCCNRALQQLGRWQWFQQEMAELDAIGSFDADPQLAWRRFKGFHELDPERQRAGTRALRLARAARHQRRSAAQLDPARRGVARHRAAGAAQLAELGAPPNCPRAFATTAARRSWRSSRARSCRHACRRCRSGSGPIRQTTAAVRKLSQLAQQIGRELGHGAGDSGDAARDGAAGGRRPGRRRL